MATVSPIVILNKNTVRRKKSTENSTKRTHSSTSTNSPIHEEKKSKFFVTPNRFQVLATEEQDNVFVQIGAQLVSPTIKNSPKPSNIKLPNFVLKKVTDFISFNKDLICKVGSEGFTCKANRSIITIRSNTRDHFMTIKYYLIDANYDYHSYLPHSSQPFRVVLRHIHYSTPTVDIINCLSDLGHKVISISNIPNRANKVPLSLFNISLARNTNNRDIFNINKILKFEYPKRQLGPPQCHHCQMYGHTRNYCHHYPRCVKCGFEHTTDTCTKKRGQPAKCANCDGDNTANYKGCKSFKKIPVHTSCLPKYTNKKYPHK